MDKINQLLDAAPEYWQQYIERVADLDIYTYLMRQMDEIDDFFDEVPVKKGDYAYEAGKWTIKEVVGHMMDTERIMCYRALCIARGEKKELPGFDENEYVKNGEFNRRSLENLVDEFHMVRQSTIAFLKSLTKTSLSAIGKANGKEISVIALFYIIGGHTDHHLEMIGDKYL